MLLILKELASPGPTLFRFVGPTFGFGCYFCGIQKVKKRIFKLNSIFY
jgi:hypothetical protein